MYSTRAKQLHAAFAAVKNYAEVPESLIRESGMNVPFSSEVAIRSLFVDYASFRNFMNMAYSRDFLRHSSFEVRGSKYSAVVMGDNAGQLSFMPAIG